MQSLCSRGLNYTILSIVIVVIYSLVSFICIEFSYLLQSDWPMPMPAIGRIANYSSLRKHRPRENQIYDSYFGEYFYVYLS